MLFAIDIGNTNITLGAYDSGILSFTARLATDPLKTSDQYAVEIKNILGLYGLDYNTLEDCIISSVVPAVGKSVRDAGARLCGSGPIMVGALEEYTMPCVVIDLGTATTLSVIDRNGAFLGGTIAAGVRLTLKALTENTAQLTSIPIEAPRSVIGANTVESMQSGLVFGTAAMLDGLLDKIEEELGETPTVVATGGLAAEIIAHCRRNIIYNENLLLDGLRAIYEKNN